MKHAGIIVATQADVRALIDRLGAAEGRLAAILATWDQIDGDQIVPIALAEAIESARAEAPVASLAALRLAIAKAAGGASGTADRWRVTPGYGFAADALDEIVIEMYRALDGAPQTETTR